MYRVGPDNPLQRATGAPPAVEHREDSEHREVEDRGAGRKRVLHLNASCLSESGPSGPSGPGSEKPAENGPLSGPAFSEATQKRSTKAGNKSASLKSRTKDRLDRLDRFLTHIRPRSVETLIVDRDTRASTGVAIRTPTPSDRENVRRAGRKAFDGRATDTPPISCGVRDQIGL